MKLERRHIELLLAVQRTGSLTAAARVLGSDQGNVSRMLYRIEAGLGLTVFDRGPHGCRATAAGLAVLDRAADAADALDRLEAPGAVRRSLHVVVTATNFEFVTALQRDRPDLDVVTTVAGSQDEAHDLLLSGTADVVVGTRIPYKRWPADGRIAETDIITEQPVVVLSPDHPLAGTDPLHTLDLRDLADADWVSDGTPELLRLLVGECQALGGFEPQVRQRRDAADAVRLDGAVAVGGSSVLLFEPELVVRRYHGACALREIVRHVPGSRPARDVTAVVDAVRRMNVAAVEQVTQLLGWCPFEWPAPPDRLRGYPSDA